MKRDYRLLIIFICMFIAGCARLKNIDSINAKKIKNEVDEYYSKFSAQSMLGNIKTVNKLSTEWDGEITKYIDKEDKVCRCSIVVFGETGRSTSEYWFLDKYIYVEELKEYYSYPIYIDYTRPVDVLYRTFNEYIIYKGEVYLLEGGHFKKAEDKLPVSSLEEIDKAMEE
nr:hypothetical protein [uncultured Lachnoanaerobaculum sp.]